MRTKGGNPRGKGNQNRTTAGPRGYPMLVSCRLKGYWPFCDIKGEQVIWRADDNVSAFEVRKGHDQVESMRIIALINVRRRTYVIKDCK